MRIPLKVSCLLLVAVSCFTGCQKKDAPPEETTFVYTFMSNSSAFSLKFNESDTVYLKSYKGSGSESYALLKNRDSLDALIREVDFAKYDTLYMTKENRSHITSIQFHKKANNLKEEITLIGDGPEALYKTAIHFNKLATKLVFSPYDGKQDYGTFGAMMTPPPLPMKVQEAPKDVQDDFHIE